MNKINENEKLIWLLSNSGFGSEINNLLYAINYSNKNCCRIILEDTTWNFKIRKGWTDYFSSLREENDKSYFKIIRLLLIFADKYIGVPKLTYYENNRHNFFKLKNLNGEKVFTFKILIYLFFRFNINIFKPKKAKLIFESFYEIRSFNLLEKQTNEKKFISDINKILINIWRITPNINNKIINKKIKIDSDYAALHIRRGDKVSIGEDVFYEVDDYMNKLITLNLNIRDVFVMSDDFTVVIDLKERFPNYNFLTIINDNEKGHLQDSFNRKTIQEKEESAISLLTEIEIARDAKIFIGSKKSNLFRLIEYFKEKNCHDIGVGECDYDI